MHHASPSSAAAAAANAAIFRAKIRPSDLRLALSTLPRAQAVFRPPLVVCRSHKSSAARTNRLIARPSSQRCAPVARVSAHMACRPHRARGLTPSVVCQRISALCHAHKSSDQAREVSDSALEECDRAHEDSASRTGKSSARTRRRRIAPDRVHSSLRALV